MARARKTKSSSVKVNFKGVESRKTPPEGDYYLEVLEANNKAGPSGDMIEFILEISKGEYKGQKLWFYCPLAENSLWKLHAFLTALGEDVPEDEMDIDLSDLIGKEIIGVLTHETYQGKKRAKMTDFTGVEDYEGDAEGDEDDKKSKSKKSKGKKSDDDDDGDDAAPDYDEMDEDDLVALYVKREIGTKKAAKKLDEDELKEALTEWDEENAPKKPAKKAAKGKSKASDDDDDDKPAKGKKSKKDEKPAKKAKSKKYTTEEVEDMDEDELQAVIDKHDLDTDLDDFKKLPKKVAAVLEALEEEDLIDDD